MFGPRALLRLRPFIRQAQYGNNRQMNVISTPGRKIPLMTQVLQGVVLYFAVLAVPWAVALNYKWFNKERRDAYYRDKEGGGGSGGGAQNDDEECEDD